MNNFELFDINVLREIAGYLEYCPESILMVVRSLLTSNRLNTIMQLLPFGQRTFWSITHQYQLIKENIDSYKKIVGDSIHDVFAGKHMSLTKLRKVKDPCAESVIIENLEYMRKIRLDRVSTIIIKYSAYLLPSCIGPKNNVKKIVSFKPMLLSTYKHLISLGISDITIFNRFSVNEDFSPLDPITDIYIVPQSEAISGKWFSKITLHIWYYTNFGIREDTEVRTEGPYSTDREASLALFDMLLDLSRERSVHPLWVLKRLGITRLLIANKQKLKKVKIDDHIMTYLSLNRFANILENKCKLIDDKLFQKNNEHLYLSSIEISIYVFDEYQKPPTKLLKDY